MQHRNCVLHGMLRQVPWRKFDALVEAHQADKHVRELPTKTQFVSLAFAQLCGISGLRETVTALNSQTNRLYHLGARPVARSTLSDANTLRPSALFEELFAFLVSRAHRGLRRTLDGTTYLIDSTSAKLNQLSADWARFSAKVCGAKVHVIYDPDANQPIYAAFTTGNVNDITAAHDMPIDPGATYVFDLGYYDYGWWARLQATNCRIVTRLKGNTRLTVTRERLVAPGGPILSDCIGTLPARLTYRRQNPMSVEVREVRVRSETGKVLRILTNDLCAPAHEIADLYKRRWMIELFFRWIKQTLRIKRFIGTSENAVRIQ
jgi:IS4 transposase